MSRKKNMKQYKWELYNFYKSKFGTLFRKSLEFEGLEPYEVNYIMNAVFEGTPIAAFRLNTNKETKTMVGFGNFVTQSYGMYRQPVELQIIKENNSPFIPTKTLRVHEDASVLNLRYNPFKMISILIDKLVEFDITMNQNLKTLRMPYVIRSGDPKTIEAIRDAIEGHTVVEVGFEFADVMNTTTPYNLDKLYRNKIEIEHEILTILGIDNVKFEKGAQMNNDEINANNDEINVFKIHLIQDIEKWFDEINELFGVEFSLVENTFYAAEDTSELEYYEDKDKEEV